MLNWRLKLKLGGWKFWKYFIAEVYMRDDGSNRGDKREDPIDF